MQLAKVLYCKLLTNGKQLPAFQLEGWARILTLMSEMGGRCVTTAPSCPLIFPV